MTRESHSTLGNGRRDAALGGTVARLGLVAMVAGALPGCASIDPRSAAPAFADSAHAARDAFSALDRDEREAFLAETLSQPASDLRIAPTRGCLVEDAAGMRAAMDCRARILVRGVPADVGAAGPNLLAVSDALVRYADALADSASARDLDERQAALRSVAASAGSLSSMAGVPGVQAIGDLLADAARARDAARRRRALARIAEAVDPAVQGVAVLLGRRAQLLRLNVALARSQAVVAAEAAYASPPPGIDRPTLARGVIGATDDLRAVASADVDFSSLGTAHRALIDSLAHPRADPSDALRQIGAFAGDAAALRKAIGKGE